MVEAVVRSLPLDARGRRALDEALADWLYEDEQPGSPARRVARTATSLLAVAPPQGLGFWCVAVISIAAALILNARAERMTASTT